MLHGSEMWPVKKQNEMTLQPGEMRMIRWMCGITVIDKSLMLIYMRAALGNIKMENNSYVQ